MNPNEFFRFLLRLLSMLLIINILGISTAYAQIDDSDLVDDKGEEECRVGLYEPINQLSLNSILERAIICVNSDNFNICNEDIRNIYNEYLKEWKSKLESHQKNTTAPLEKLELQKIINSIKGRRQDIQRVNPSDCQEIACDDCDSEMNCRQKCLNNREKMEEWRKRYKDVMQGNQYLSCDDCLTALEDYYEGQKRLFEENKLNVRKLYTKQHLDTIWGLLFCLSKSADENNMSCLDKAQKILPHAMLPFVLPPSELIQLLNDKLGKEGGLSVEEEKSILEKNEQSIYVIKVLVSLIKKSGRIPDIPPGDLADVLINLIESNKETLQNMTKKELLLLFGEISGALSTEDLDCYSMQSPEFKEKIAKLFVAAIKKQDQATLDMLEAVGFNNEDLTNLMVAFYKKMNDAEKESFVDSMRKMFEKDRVIINKIVSEYFLKAGDEAQKRFIENSDAGQIEKLFDNLQEVRPDLCANRPDYQQELKHKYLKSFLIPGYPKYYYEKDVSLGIRSWNYSNYALLGVSLISQILFINSEYKDDDYYRAGVIGTYLFTLNGLTGVIHAAFYNPPDKIKASKTDFGISISDDRLVAICRINF